MNVANLFLWASRPHADLPEEARGPDLLLSYGELVRRGAVLAARLRAAPESQATRDRPYMIPMVGQPLMSIACRARISLRAPIDYLFNDQNHCIIVEES